MRQQFGKFITAYEYHLCLEEKSRKLTEDCEPPLQQRDAQIKQLQKRIEDLREYEAHA
jgi:hypothetical protein